MNEKETCVKGKTKLDLYFNILSDGGTTLILTDRKLLRRQT